MACRKDFEWEQVNLKPKALLVLVELVFTLINQAISF
jgi:hypothetical protein